MAKNSEDKEDAQSILELARKRFDLAVEAEAEIRIAALDDLKFRAGDQWPADLKREREKESKPSLTINRLPQFIRQVTNDQRQNRPSIKVNPVDDLADIETAKVYQGLIRHIEYSSNADVAYDTAFEGAATKGLGYFRIITDYCDPNSFDQEILIKRIRNSFSVYLDPNYQEPDGSDANWGFIFEDMSLDDYKAQFKNSEMAGMNDWESIGDSAPGWATKDTCRIAEYFYKSFREVTLVRLSNGEVFDKKEFLKILEDGSEEMILPEGLRIIDERKSILPEIKWCKINAVEVLEKTDWPGRWIPIIPVLGDELDVDGKRILEGVIRHAKDPQQMYNYWASCETETIALAPRAPFIGAAGAFEGHEDKWSTANSKSHAYLEYNQVDVNGQLAAPPSRNIYEPPVQAITQARIQSSEDLKATTGIYDASLGNRSNENSGVAIQRRNAQSQTNNFHFIDNLSRALRHAGRILIDIIPSVYDTARTVRTMGEDGTVDMVAINQVFESKGEKKIHRLGHGKYDVTISTGPTFATKRQEAVESMLALSQSYPKVSEVAGDLMVKNMDWPGAQEISERLKKTLPPGLIEPKEGEQNPIPPEIQQQMAQMNQLIDGLTEKLNESQEIIKNKTIELESRERIEMSKIQANIEIEMAKMGSQEAQLLLRQEIEDINRRMELLGANEPINFENNDAGSLGAGMSNEQPTGGFSPGTPPMEG